MSERNLTKKGALSRDKILQVAEQCLLERPYRDLSIPALSEWSSLSIGAIYGHFRSRDEILDAVFERYEQRRNAVLQAAVGGGGLIDARIQVVADAFVELHSENAGILRCYLIERWFRRDPESVRPRSAETDMLTSRVAEFLRGARDAPDRGLAQYSCAVQAMISVSKDQLALTVRARSPSRAEKRRIASDLRVIAAALIHKKEQAF